MVIVIRLKRSFICDFPPSTTMADSPERRKCKKKTCMNLIDATGPVLFCSLCRDSRAKARATQRAAASERLASATPITATDANRPHLASLNASRASQIHPSDPPLDSATSQPKRKEPDEEKENSFKHSINHRVPKVSQFRWLLPHTRLILIGNDRSSDWPRHLSASQRRMLYSLQFKCSSKIHLIQYHLMVHIYFRSHSP
jgi:hypothetical protein